MSSGSRTLVAGAIGGGIVFGDRGSVNTQINLYVMSRVIMNIGHALLERGALPSLEVGGESSFFNYYRLWASITWALVMYLFVKV
jgi:hypothetical protein